MSALHDDGRIYMCPGGVADIENTGDNIKRRRGFLRVARETRSHVVPVWCPEERSYYSHWLPLGKTLKEWLFFPIPMIIVGRWWCPLVPRPPKVSRVFVGEPIAWDDEHQEERFWHQMIELQLAANKESDED